MFAKLRMRPWFALPLLLLGPCLLMAAPVGPAPSTDEPINVLVLSFGNRDQPGFVQFLDEFRTGLEQRVAVPIFIYVETFDEYRAANDPSFDRTMEQFLAQKYQGRKLDLLVTVGNRPLDFLLPRRARLFPGTKLLYSTVFREPVPEATGVILQLNYLPTIEIALRQNPGTKRLLLITGSSPADRAGTQELVGFLKSRFRSEGRAIEVEVLPPVTYSEARRRLASLPRDTVCVFDSYYMDSAGQIFTPTRVLPVFSQVSTRPIYSAWDTDVGRGGVGGRVVSITDIGRTMALLAARVLSGEDPAKIPPVRGEFQRYLFDWEQMKRWGIRLDQLPPGSTVINREYTAWELYKWQIIGGVALMVAELGLILLLLRLRAIRRRAEQKLARQYELELVIAELSAAFISLPSELLNAEVDSALQRLLGFLQLDRISVFEFSAQDSSLHLLAATAAAGVARPPSAIDARQLPWAIEKLLRDEPIVVSKLEELPPEALPLKELMQRQRVKSIAIFPLRSDGETFGTLGFSAMRHEVEWTADTLRYLKTVSDIFGTALKRRRVQEALVSSEQLKTSILSSLSSQIAVLDRDGRIIAANDRWEAFTRENAGRPDWMSGNNPSFEVCRGCETACEGAESVWEGIQRVCRGEREAFEMEYECPSESGEERWFLMAVAPLRSAGGGVVIAHHDISQSKRSEQAIRDLSGRLITAQEEERSRIARELHDDINQQLALLAIDLQRIEGSLPGDAHGAHTLLHELWKKTNGLSADIQRISHQLHSAKLEHLGLISALRGLCQEFSRQQKMGIEFQSRDVPSHLDRGVALGLFRIAQECLRNAGKHSQAKNVRVELAGEHGGVVLRVSDDGMGFDSERMNRAGLGMVSMQERIRLVGGKLRVSSARSSGTQVEATVPLPAAEGRELTHTGAERKA